MNSRRLAPARPLTRLALVVAATVVGATSVAACSGGSTAGGAAPGSTGASSTTVSGTPKPTQSDVASADAPAPAAGGDFCATQGKWLDYAKTYDSAAPTKEQAQTYADLAKHTDDLAPAAIKEDVRIVVVLATTAAMSDTGVRVPVDVAPQTPERITAAAGAVKDWTKAHCSADIAAKWEESP